MTVFLTRRAEKNYDAIKARIRKKWGEKTAEEFTLKTDEFFHLLKAFPAMGQLEKDDIRGISINTTNKNPLPDKGRPCHYSGIVRCTTGSQEKINIATSAPQ